MIKRVKELRPDADLASPQFREFLEKFESEINRGISTLCVLSIISLNNDEGIYGYKIIKVLKEETSDWLVIEEGTLYPLLRNLEREGFIESKKLTTGRRKKYYYITENGQKILNYLTGYYSKLTKAISNLVDIKVELKNKYIYCPMCANKIEKDRGDVRFCSVCGYNLEQKINERGFK